MCGVALTILDIYCRSVSFIVNYQYRSSASIEIEFHPFKFIPKPPANLFIVSVCVYDYCCLDAFL